MQAVIALAWAVAGFLAILLSLAALGAAALACGWFLLARYWLSGRYASYVVDSTDEENG